ncbi:unnamed protein product, partial [Thlaspi arvense]
SFGVIGAVLVENELHNEMYLKNIVFDGLAYGILTVSCNSWVAPKSDNSEKRIFFTNKHKASVFVLGLLMYYLISSAALGVSVDSAGCVYILCERKTNDRIYDYDVYNDLGDPDSKSELKRPVLGGKLHPYPRRCRTGRPHCKTDPLSESRSASVYVPRDEAFSKVKLLTFSLTTAEEVVHALFQTLDTIFVDPDLGFATFTDIESLYNEGIKIPPLSKNGFLKDLFPGILKCITDTEEQVIRFDTPKLFESKRQIFLVRDEEFARQTLAGVNPYSIQLVKEWPLMSKLNPEIYGAPESAITSEVVEQQIKGFMNLEAIVREIKGTTLYGSRTLFFLTPDGTLMPLAIELTRPPLDDKPLWRQVFTPSSCDATASWLWRLAKTHVLAHDSGHHELISHWLRTHCATEPYIIATNRQLSAMHPIYRLLHPHFRYTMEINALAREALINADVSSRHHSHQPRECCGGFQPRRMAETNNRDYPFANDGLSSGMPLGKIRTVGHGDKKDDPWWPVLNTSDDLIGTVTTIIWVASGHHSAVNFGQYAFGDEEYLGEEMESSWAENPKIKACFELFNRNLREIVGIIDARNKNKNLKNRSGAGVVPYELLKPFSGPGMTEKGVPNSISI